MAGEMKWMEAPDGSGWWAVYRNGGGYRGFLCTVYGDDGKLYCEDNDGEPDYRRPVSIMIGGSSPLRFARPSIAWPE